MIEPMKLEVRPLRSEMYGHFFIFNANFVFVIFIPFWSKYSNVDHYFPFFANYSGVARKKEKRL